MSRSTRLDMQRRWQTEEGSAKLNRIVSLAAKGDAKGIAQTAGRIDGRVDLRGMKLKVPVTESHDVNLSGRSYRVDLGMLKFDTLEMSDVGFDFCELDGIVFEDCGLSHASFQHVEFLGWRDFGSTYTQTSFRRSSFRKICVLGSHDNETKKVTQYFDCDFSNSRMHRCTATFPLFENCRFEDVILDNVDFEGSRFIDCVFSGRMYEVHFRGLFEALDMDGYWQPPRSRFANPMRNVDFSRCSVDGLDFKVDMDLSSVTMPSEDDHIFVWFPKRTYTRALESAKREAWGDLKASEKGMTMREFFAFLVEEESRGTETQLAVLDRKKWISDLGDLFGTHWVDAVEKCSKNEAPHARLR